MGCLIGLILLVCAISILIWFSVNKKRKKEIHSIYVCNDCNERDCVCHLEIVPKE